MVNRYLGKTSPQLQWQPHPHQIHLINQDLTPCQLTIWKCLSTREGYQSQVFLLTKLIILKVMCSHLFTNSFFAYPSMPKNVIIGSEKELLFNTVPAPPGVVNQSNGYGSHFNGNNYEYSRRVLGATLDNISHFRSQRYDSSNPIFYPSY